MDRSGVAEQVQIGHGGRLGPCRNRRKVTGGKSSRYRPTQGGGDGIRVRVPNLVDGVVEALGVIDLAFPTMGQGDVQPEQIAVRQLGGRSNGGTFEPEIIVDPEIGRCTAARIIRIEGRYLHAQIVGGRRTEIGRVDVLRAAIGVEPFAEEGNVLGQALIDRHHGGIFLLCRVVPGDRIGIDFVRRAAGRICRSAIGGIGAERCPIQR